MWSIKKVVLHWDNRRDDTVSDLGVLKSGGQTAAKDAPGRKGRLTAVTVNMRSSMMPRRPPSRSGDLTERTPPDGRASKAVTIELSRLQRTSAAAQR